MEKIMVLYGSSRRNGNTDYLADKLTENLSATKVYLQDLDIQPIVDKRHDTIGFPEVTDDYENLLNHFLDHDVYIFVSPLYWFGMSAQLKVFFDRWSQYKDNKEWDFLNRIHGKKAYFITAANDEPLQEVTAPLVKQFELICNYIGLDYVESIVGKGSRPDDVKDDVEVLSKVSRLNTQLMSQYS